MWLCKSGIPAKGWNVGSLKRRDIDLKSWCSQNSTSSFYCSCYDSNVHTMSSRLQSFVHVECENWILKCKGNFVHPEFLYISFYNNKNNIRKKETGYINYFLRCSEVKISPGNGQFVQFHYRTMAFCWFLGISHRFDFAFGNVFTLDGFAGNKYYFRPKCIAWDGTIMKQSFGFLKSSLSLQAQARAVLALPFTYRELMYNLPGSVWQQANSCL